MQDDYLGNDPDDAAFGTSPERPTQRSSTNWGLIIGIVAGVGLLGLVLCCGISWYLFQFSSDVMGEQIRGDLENNAVIEEQIGTIQSVSFDMTKTAAASHEEKLVFRIEGDKGSGYLKIDPDTSAAGQLDISSGSLRMDSGETFPLTPEETPIAEDEPVETSDEPEGTNE